MKNPNNPCLFCNTSKKEIIFENDLAFVTFDSYPVSQFHSLIIPKRHIQNYFDLTNYELLACHGLLLKIKNKINSDDNTVGGFNIGANSERIAGQSILHCHIHLIPRREGDVDNPQGGVRSVIPSRQHYVHKSK
jgi:diadenosine tetraphosphate (Ap4A) HIT family hydrolase